MWTRHFGIEYAAPQVVRPQADGSVLVGGYHSYATGSRRTPVLVRFLDDGALDPAFGDGGVVTLPSTALLGDATVQDLAVQPDGRIVTVGRARSGFTTAVGVARFLPDGSPDPTFGTNGQVLVTAAQGAAGHALALQSDGRLVVAGTAYQGGLDRLLQLRLDTDGSVDATLGTNGRQIVTGAAGHHTVSRAAVRPDGRIVVSGQASGAHPGTLLLARFTPDGALDPNFGDGGLVRHEGVYSGRGLVLTASTTTVVGHGHGNRMTVLRVLDDGQPDPTFGSGGRLDLWVGGTWGRAVAQDGQGRLLVGGHNGYDLSVVRLLPRTGCALAIDVPAVVPAGSALRVDHRWAEASGAATSLAGITLATSAIGEGEAISGEGGPFVGTAVTDHDGSATVELDLAPGRYEITSASRSNDRFEGCGAGPVDTIVRGSAELSAEPVTASLAAGPRVEDPARVAATLTWSAVPLPDRQLEFTTTDGQPLCTASTGPDGRASCDATAGVLRLVLGQGYQVDFAGDDVFDAASARGALR